MNEIQAIAASKAGGADSYNWLVATYERQVYNLALSMLGNPHDAEDATQDAFISAYRSIRKFSGGSFKPWICRIASNLCIDKLRYRKRHPASSIDDNPIELPSKNLSGQPEEQASRRELRGFIDQSLAKLPSDLRLAVVLSDIQGMTYEEIAQVMRCPLGTVRSRIWRGRRKMRELLLEKRELLPGQFRL